MARIRTIKPEFWVDDVMVELSFLTRLLYIGLWNFVDDEGYIEDKPKRIKMQVFPADEVSVEDSLNALEDSGRLHAFDSDQGRLLQITNWLRHQKISHPTPTRFTGITRASGRSSRNAPEKSGALRPEGKGKEGKGKEGKGRERKKPTNDSKETYDCNVREFPSDEIEEVGEILSEHSGASLDDLETAVALEFILESATEPVSDVPAYVRKCVEVTPERIAGICAEARRQVERTRA